MKSAAAPFFPATLADIRSVLSIYRLLNVLMNDSVHSFARIRAFLSMVKVARDHPRAASGTATSWSVGIMGLLFARRAARGVLTSAESVDREADQVAAAVGAFLEEVRRI